MRKAVFVLAVLIAAGVAFFFYSRLAQISTLVPADEPSTTNLHGATTKAPPLVHSNATAIAVKTNANSISSNAAAPSTTKTNSAPEAPPEIVMEKIRRAVHQFGQMFDGNPVGTNPEITAALSGTNPKHINFLTGLPGVRVNSDGEMIDAWGTPYFFHQLSGTEMEIHSAGPDKIMWTSDDLVTQ